MLAEAARHPKRFIERLPKALDSRAAHEVAVLGAMRYARNDPAAAAAALEGPLAERLSDAELKYLWGVVGYEAAREHHNDALKWFARAGDTPLDDRHLAWKVRAALRDGEWKVVRESIDRMSFGAAHQPAWIYWYGARSPPRARRWAAAHTSCASPARPTSTACSRPRSSAMSSRCPTSPTCRPRRMSPRLRPIRVSSARSS